MFRANPSIHIASMMEQFQCELPGTTCKPIQSQDTTGDQGPFETTWRSHSIAICRHGLGKDNRIATHYCKTHRCDAPVPVHKVPQHMQTTIALQHTTVQHIPLIPMHKVSQHMQSTKAQHQQRREKVTWNRQLHCANMSSKIPRQSDDAEDRRTRKPTFLRPGTSLYPKKSRPRDPRWQRGGNIHCQVRSQKITMFRANPSIQIASMMEQFQCELPRTTCKTIQSQDTTGDQVPFETPWCSHSMLRHMPTGPRDHCAQLTCALGDYEVTFP